MHTWNYLRIIQIKERKECINFSICRKCKDMLSYNIKNGSSHLNFHFDKFQVNKTDTNTNAGNIRSTIFKATFNEVDKKDKTKSCVVYLALYLLPFFAISGQDFKLFLIACINIAQNKTGEIDFDDLLLHPNTVSRNIFKYEAEAKQGLVVEIDTLISELVSTVFPTDITI